MRKTLKTLTGMGNKNKIAYCKKCNQDIAKPKKRKIEGIAINIWVIAIVVTLGGALIPFLIYRKLILKGKYCPICGEKVEFHYKEKEIKVPLRPIGLLHHEITSEIELSQNDKEKDFENDEISEMEEILDEKKEEKDTYCQLCHHKIEDSRYTHCPYCREPLKE